MCTSGYELVPANDDEFDALLASFRAAFGDLVDRTHGPWTDQQWRTEFADDIARGNTQVVKVDSTIVGFVDFDCANGADVHVTTIAIAPGHQRKGIGTHIMRDLMERTKGQLTLQVVRGNSAKVWYDRLGFSLREETATHWKLKYP